MIIKRAHARVVTAPSPLENLGLLTEREREVLRAVCVYGMTDAAYRQCRSRHTLKNQMSSVYDKLGIKAGHANKAGRVCYALGLADGRREARSKGDDGEH